MRATLFPAVLLLACLAAPPGVGAALPPEADQLVLEGLDALYGLDFETAEGKFREVERLAPDHPAGPLFLSGMYWIQFSQNADLPGTADTLEPNFNRLIDQSISRAKGLVKTRPDDAEGHFYLGVGYGMRGRWQILKRQWIRAAMNGYKGYKSLLKTVELDPGYEDAYLGLGMYDYYSDKLPAVLKLASIVIVRGDKERGLKYVERTTKSGHFSRTEAKLFLIVLYTGYENTPEKSLPIVLELRMGKPDNLFFTFMEVMSRIDLKDWTGAIAFGEHLASRVRQVAYTQPQASLFDMYLGEAYMGAKDYERAAQTLTRCIVEAPDPRKAAVTFCFLRRAQVFDLMGRREEALKDYRFVRARPDFFDSEEKARLGLKAPATYDLVIGQFLE